MKKILALIPLTVFGLLTGCDVTSSSSSSESLTTSSSIASKTPKELMSSISGTLALKGHYSATGVYGEESYEMTSYDISSALTEDCFYYRVEDQSLGLEDQRVDKEADGRAQTSYLNPLTNAVEKHYYGDEVNGYYPFEALFTNPFAKSSHLFSVEDDKLVLTDSESFNFTYLINIITGGNGFDYYTDVESLSIKLENDNPVSLEVVLANNTWIEYGESTKYTYTGTFVTVEEINISAVPLSKAPQAGQEKLEQMFSRLHNYNYTMTVTSTSDYGEEDDGEEEEIEPRKAVSYVTPDGYYNEYISGFYGQNSDGKYMTDQGMVEFVEKDGVITETKLPYLSRNIETYFGFAFSYSSRSFNVNEDKSFTLASEKGFYSAVWTDLLPDYNALSVGMMDEGSLTFVIDENNDTLTYTYTCFDGAESYETIISNIGTTTLPFKTADVQKYTPFTNWTEYCASDRWNEEWGQALDILTGGHKDDVPYIDTPYNYQRSSNQDYDDDGNLVAVSDLSMVLECDSTQEMVGYAQRLYNQLNSIDKYTYDKAKDLYVYETAEAKFELQIALSNGFMSMDGLFNRAVIITITNLK